MKVVADQKRRVVLPKPTEPGDVFEVIGSGDRVVLVKLARPARVAPPVSEAPVNPGTLAEIDLDQPAFDPLSDESPA